MPKRRSTRTPASRREPDLLAKLHRRRHRALILPKYLAEEAGRAIHRGQSQDRANEVLRRWVDLEADGHLRKKETALDADFLLQVFGEALEYAPATGSPEGWQLERNYTVPGVGTADGALGNFRPGDLSAVAAVIELKGAAADLDRDRFNGRTAVQQCWDYLNALPQCTWGIVSNFVTVRLYHRDRTPQKYEEFALQDLRRLDRFREFYCLFHVSGLLRPTLGRRPLAVELLERTENRQREVGDKLYQAYSDNRAALIEHLMVRHGKPLETAIHIAQKILDRIVFIAFCEDRGLLPGRSIDTAHKTIPPFSKATNPRWQNFLNLFHAIDRGHSSLDLETGYNGGLFRHDPEVDDLQLDDDWTNFFQSVGTYDFRDEVNVDVLGHIFEKSITELEKLRVGGLFPSNGGNGVEPAMPKSAERKRFGVYYTPPQFTTAIVDSTLGALIDERFAAIRAARAIAEEALDSEDPSSELADYWRECFDALRRLRVCDPACGSGAFLIQAYELLEDRYTAVCNNLLLHRPPGSPDDGLADRIPDIILAENLYGVDLSEQAVEITQLALWIRSARRGRTLADLSANIVCRNSLVTDPDVDPRAIDWQAVFPEVFTRPERGFDCVIGNPPWERLKLQEREFFAFSAPAIAGAVSAAQRRRLIAELQRTRPELFARYTEAKDRADRVLQHVRTSGRFPLTGKGDVNTYVLFAELARSLLAPHGRAGLLVPSGIATDNTTKEFFAELMESQALIRLYDFENRRRIFPDVDSRFKFCMLVFGGSQRRTPAAEFVFFAHQIEDLNEKQRHISLTGADLRLLNPNTRTCPIFRFRRDADLTRAVYRRVPVLVDENREQGGNPWDVRFVRMFDQTNAAELFHEPQKLAEAGFQLRGNRWTKGGRTFLPLYEAKMVQAWDHRAAGVVVQKGNWVRQGQTEPTTLVDHQNPEFAVLPRWWVDEAEVSRALDDRTRDYYLCYKDVTSPTNQRTMIAAMLPHVGVLNSAPLVLTAPEIPPRLACCLLANLNSYALDFIARQKVGNVHLNFFIVKQLPLFPPDAYAERCPWNKRQTLERWISDRALKLTCTANDMQPLAEAAGLDPPVHKWNPRERAELQAELDAAFFVLYGLGRDDVEYVLGTFRAAGRKAEGPALFGTPGNAVLEAYDRLSARAEA